MSKTEVKLNEGERIDPLGGGYSIVVSKDHIFGTDAVLLANFSKIRKNDTACDLGSGCGIIPLLWCKKESGRLFAVEIQKKACAQFEKSLSLNLLEGRISVLNRDLRELKGALPFGAFDLVTMNPPYKKVGAGIESVSESDKIARHETMCSIDDCCEAASKLLRFGGRLCLCHRPERLCDVISSMKKNGIEPKRLRFVSKNAESAPWLFLIEGKRGAQSFLNIEKNLYIETADGKMSPELCEIMGDYAKESMMQP